MFPSDQTNSSPVMLSALQHYLFCPRQCALIHVEVVVVERSAKRWIKNQLEAVGT